MKTKGKKAAPAKKAKKMGASGISIHAGRGRPRKGEETGPTTPRSIRFPAPMWKILEKLARAESITVHGALRAAVLAWVSARSKKG